MPLDKYGRVIVDPRIPLGMPEIARLYQTEGSTPAEAASNIHLRWPTEAKSYLSEAWSALGINSSPEQYFNQPLNFPRVASPETVPSPASILKGKGMGSAPTTIGTPQFASSANYLSGIPTREEMEAYTRSKRPIYSAGMSDEDLLAAQLTGDSGDIKSFLMRMQGLDPNEQITLSPSDRAPLKPYRSAGQLGSLSNERSGSLPLDIGLYMSKEFQEMMQRDPSRAQFVYEQLKGRSLKTDIDQSGELRDEQIKAGRSFARRQIEQGAYREPATGKWKIWAMDEAEQNGLSLGTQRPFRQRLDATEDQARWLDEYYSSVTGRNLPEPPEFPASVRSAAESRKLDPAVAAAIMAKEKELGQKLTPMEEIVEANRVADMQGQPGAWDKYNMSVESMWKKIFDWATPRNMEGLPPGYEFQGY